MQEESDFEVIKCGGKAIRGLKVGEGIIIRPAVGGFIGNRTSLSLHIHTS